MTTLSYILGGIVFLYTVVYGIKKLAPILRYSKLEKDGEIIMADGNVFEKVAEENKAFQGVMVNVCLPKFEYEIGGEKRYCQGTVRYHNASIGQLVRIGYCERTGEAWVIKDIPLMKKDLLVRMLTMIAILMLLVLTELLL